MASAYIPDTEDTASQLLRHLREAQGGAFSQVSQADYRLASLLFVGGYSARVLRSFFVGETFCIATMGTSGEKDLVVITGLSLTVYKKPSIKMNVLVTASTPWEYRSLPGDATPSVPGMSWSVHLRNSILRYLAWKDGKQIPSGIFNRLLIAES